MRVKINGAYYDHFTELVLNSAIDAVASTFTAQARFDANDPVHRAIFKPLSYPKVEFFNDDDTLFFTGVIVNHNFRSSAIQEPVVMAGYSLGGVLEDCTIPYSQYPLESLDRSLQDITQRLCNIFKLKLVTSANVRNECAIPYAKSVAKATGTIKDYLAKLASQRNVLLSHDPSGNVLLFRPSLNAQPVAFFNEQTNPDMGLDVNGQGMHSLLTVITQPAAKEGGLFDDSDASTSQSLSNPMVKAYRPFVDVQTSGDADTSRNVLNTLASELKNIKVGFSLNKFQNLNTGDIVEIENPGIYIYRRTKFLIENVIRTLTPLGENMAITCVLPETYNGVIPKSLFE